MAFVSKKLFQQFSIELVLSLIPKVIPFIRLGVITIRLLISCNHLFEWDNSRNREKKVLSLLEFKLIKTLIRINIKNI